ncbi:MAG: hypothetical protein K2X32_02190 [Phycisphaerales bacterium]|nr:hypothetical protein [Phycisphaerales bacterium]
MKKTNGQRGASMIEYALLVALVALIAVPSIKMLGNETQLSFENARNAVAGAGQIQPTPAPCNDKHPNWPFCS